MCKLGSLICVCVCVNEYVSGVLESERDDPVLSRKSNRKTSFLLREEKVYILIKLKKLTS